MTEATFTTCLQCKSWRLVSNYVRKTDGKHVMHGACERARGSCFEPNDKTSKAFAIGSTEQMTCDLMTDEDFACNQAEQRTGEIAVYPGWVNEETIKFAERAR